MTLQSKNSSWPKRPLIEVASLQRGYDLPVQQRVEGQYPVFAANGQLGTHNEAMAKGPGVVTGRSGTIGKVHYVDSDFWPLNTALFVTDFHGNDPKWVFHMLKSFGLERFAQGAGVPTLNRNLVHGELISVPPLVEQKRIAAILDKADSLRRKRQQAILLADDFLRAAFLEMFGDPVTNPKGWPVVAFGDVVKNCDGQRVPVSSADRSLRQGAYPYYGASGVIDTIDDFLFEGPSLLIGEDGANLLARSTPIAFIATGKYWVNNHAHVLQENGKACLEFLEFAINHVRLDDYITGSAQPKLNQANLNRIPIALPPIELQKKFVANRSAIGKLQEKHKISLTVVGDMSSALQNEAFA